ncbi:MAG TPA: class I SAM-dependent methyltransferase [Ktedonosporobacter sp.]|nr:class I SAM-dependent methyltransferase [Ktedonosporobacter sp.]
MPDSPNRHGEQHSTYFVQDRSNRDELNRLQLQDQIITAGMGGVLAEQADPTLFQHVLDVGCGTGGWLIEVASTYPTISLLIGVDISDRMLKYARTQAESRQVNDRVEFHLMDALRTLDFPDHHFHLVNQRYGGSYLRTWDWPELLERYHRLTKPGGMVRITEPNMITESSSSALLRLSEISWLGALQQSGHLFTPDRSGITAGIPRLLHQFGFQNVQTRAHVLHYRAGTPEGESFSEVTRHFYRNLLPFFRKWTDVPDDYETIYQQMLNDMQQPDFEVTWRLDTIWGSKAPRKE